ncbi:TNT domain-containing protein [Listeria seeligeri]|nr:glycohydrolase toxin TNT-related protein [Listeria seeligeri]MBC2224886.1 TNT domain-containing protein [Listeria seeligeri]
MKLQYEAWKRENPDQDVSETDFKMGMLHTRAFDYKSVQDEQADGFVVDETGKAITVDANLKAGQIIDRYGNSFGKFTSPVEDGNILAYDTRGLPYPESVKTYHQYEAVTDINLENIQQAFDDLSSIDQRKLLQDMKDYEFTLSDIANPQTGEISKVFGAGGGTQIQLGTVVNWYEKMNLLKEIK